MMNIIEELEEALNSIIDKNKGVVVIHRAMSLNPTCKLFKKFSYKFYIVKDEKKSLVFEFIDSIKVKEEDILNKWEEEDFKCFVQSFQYLLSDKFKKYLKDV